MAVDIKNAMNPDGVTLLQVPPLPPRTLDAGAGVRRPLSADLRDQRARPGTGRGGELPMADAQGRNVISRRAPIARDRDIPVFVRTPEAAAAIHAGSRLAFDGIARTGR